MKISDADAWLLIADNLEGSRFLVLGSLCYTLVQYAREGIIGPRQWLRMEHQLYENRKKYSKGKKHFWPLKQIKPRVLACRMLARIVNDLQRSDV